MVKYKIKLKDDYKESFKLDPQKICADLEEHTLKTLGRKREVKVSYKEQPGRFIFVVYVDCLSSEGAYLLSTKLSQYLKGFIPKDKFIIFNGVGGCTIYIKK